MPIIAPGMFLSQAASAITPSVLAAWQTVSMESAITSRDTREYFMPSVPMEMPSLTVMVPKVWGTPPAARRAASTRRARPPMPMLHGVMVLWPFATPMMGLPKSSSLKPRARSIDAVGGAVVPLGDGPALPVVAHRPAPPRGAPSGPSPIHCCSQSASPGTRRSSSAASGSSDSRSGSRRAGSSPRAAAACCRPRGRCRRAPGSRGRRG